MSEELQKKQIKTYKDIIIENSDNKDIYKIDHEKEKELFESKKRLRESGKLLLKVLGAFVLLALFYIFITRVVFTFKKDPFYFSNTFHDKVNVEEVYEFEIIDPENQIGIQYLDQYIDSQKGSEGFLSIMYPYQEIDKEKEAFKTQEFLYHLDDLFLAENVQSFGEDFSLVYYTEKGVNYPFAFVDVSNFSLANKYMILWENAFMKEYENDETIHGFLSRTIANKKTRVLINKDGQTIFGYSFVDNTTLVFFENEEFFEKAVERIIISK